jgi:hypothetical protein
LIHSLLQHYFWIICFIFKKLKILFFLIIFFYVFLVYRWSFSSDRQIHKLSTIFYGFQNLSLIKNRNEKIRANIKIESRLLKLPLHSIFWIREPKLWYILYSLIYLILIFALIFLLVFYVSPQIYYKILIISSVRLQLILKSLIISIPFLSNGGDKMAKFWLLSC